MAASSSAGKAPCNAREEPILVRKFSLLTEIGENVLHKDFDHRRLGDGLDRLSLAFRAQNQDVSDCILCWQFVFLQWQGLIIR